MTNKASRPLLILPPNWLGDVVMAQPAMCAFVHGWQARYPEHEILLAGRGWLADLLPFLDLGKTGFSPNIAHAEQAVLFPNSFGAAWRLLKSKTPVRIGFRGQWRSLLLHPGYKPKLNMKQEHHRDYYLDLAEQAGMPVRERQARLTRPKEEVSAGTDLLRQHGLDPERTLCIAPGAQFGGAKRYPAESYRHVLRWLSAQGWHVLALGTPEEKNIAASCLQDVSTPHWNSAGSTSLRQALQMLAASRMLLCNDSGLMHVAAAMDLPTVAIFGATSPGRTSPSGQQVRLLYQPAVCSPCLQRECTTPGQPCMANVLPEEVRDTCLELLTP